MGFFVPSNVSICGILNFVERGKCNTPAENGDSVCCTRASIDIGARPFIVSFMWLSSCWIPKPLLPRPLPYFLLDGLFAPVVPAMHFLIAILPGGLVRVMLPSLVGFSFSIFFSRRVEVLLFFLDSVVLAFSGLLCLLGALHLSGKLL